MNDLTQDILAELLAERYGTDAALAQAQSARPAPRGRKLVEQLISHRSWRAYLPQQVSPAAIDLALAAAQSASSSSNLQAWSVIELRDPTQKAAVNALAGNQQQIAAAPVLLIWLADLSRARRISDETGSAGEGLDYLEPLVMSVIDTSLAAQNAAVALEAQGLGVCYIGGIRNQADVLAKLLNLPPEVLPVFGLTVGVPDPDRPARIKPRLPLSAVHHHGRYSAKQADASITAYAETLYNFQQMEGLPQADWRQIVSDRVASPAQLKGRENLVGYLKTLGFGLK